MMIMQAAVYERHKNDAEYSHRTPEAVLQEGGRHQMKESSQVEHHEEHKEIKQDDERRSAYLIDNGSQRHRHLIQPSAYTDEQHAEAHCQQDNHQPFAPS